MAGGTGRGGGLKGRQQQGGLHAVPAYSAQVFGGHAPLPRVCEGVQLTGKVAGMVDHRMLLRHHPWWTLLGRLVGLSAVSLALTSLHSGAGATPAQTPLETALSQAQRLAAQGRAEDCEAELLQHEALAWQAPAALRNRWHRMVWVCNARPLAADLAAMRRYADWMQRWLDCCAHEPGVDIRYRASTRVIAWTYRQAAGDDVRPELAQHLGPLVQTVLAQPAPARPPQEPVLAEPLTELLLILGEMGGQGPLEHLLLEWRERMAAAAGDAHVAVLAADKSLAFSARKYGRVPQALQRVQSAWDRQEAAGLDWPALRQSLASELAATLSASGRLGAALPYAVLTQDIVERLDGPYGVRPGRAAYNRAGLALALGDFELARSQALRAIRALTGNGSSWSEDEAHHARQLLHQARLELAEPGAADDLEQALGESSVGSDWVHLSALRLLLQAKAVGDRARARRMRSYIAENLRLTKPVFHPAHLTSLLLDDAETAPAARAIEPSIVQALVQAYVSGSAAGQTQAWLALAQAWMRQPEPAPQQALWAVKRAARALLPQLGGLSPDQQAGLLDREQALIQQLHEATLWFVEQGRLPEAEALAGELQLGEARHYLRGGLRSALRGTSEHFLPDTPLERIWSYRLESLLQQTRQQRERLLQTVPDRPLAADPTDTGRTHAQHHRNQLAAFTAAWVAWMEGLDTPTAIAATGLPSQPEIGLALAPGEALLWWAVGADRLRIVAQTAHARHAVEVAAGSAVVARAVWLARKAVTDEARLDVAALQSLHRLLLAPIEPWLQGQGVRGLTLKPPTLLMPVPFAALHRGSRTRPWLVQRYTLRIRLAGRPASSEELGVPSLHAFGTTAEQGTLPPLPWVRQELRWVARRAGPGSRQWLDGDFTWHNLQQVLGELPGRVRREGPPLSIHLASHFQLHPGTAALSWLQLGDGQRASLSDLMALSWRHSLLTVASACDTATSQDTGWLWPGGVALSSLAQGLLSAGSQAVVGSLWAVRDESTARFMDQFYAHRQRLPPDHWALAAAQREWLSRHRSGPWGHPRHWAAWVWMD